MDEKTQEKIDMIEKNYEELSVQIRSIQDFNAGISPVSRREKFDLRQLAETYYLRNRQDVEVFGPLFLLSLPPFPCPMQGNPESIARAIENMVFNSMDFTPPEGKIVLSLSMEMEIICYPSVIPDAALTRILFPIFLNAPSAQERRREATVWGFSL